MLMHVASGLFSWSMPAGLSTLSKSPVCTAVDAARGAKRLIDFYVYTYVRMKTATTSWKSSEQARQHHDTTMYSARAAHKNGLQTLIM